MAEKIIRAAKGNIVPVTLILIYFAVSNYLFSYICPSVVIFGIPCPGCGFTRAAIYLISFDFSAAFDLNPMIFIILPMIFSYIIMIFKGDGNVGRLYYPAVAVIIISVVVYLIRFKINFGTEPFIINRGALIFRTCLQ